MARVTPLCPIALDVRLRGWRLDLDDERHVDLVDAVVIGDEQKLHAVGTELCVGTPDTQAPESNRGSYGRAVSQNVRPAARTKGPETNAEPRLLRDFTSKSSHFAYIEYTVVREKHKCTYAVTAAINYRKLLRNRGLIKVKKFFRAIIARTLFVRGRRVMTVMAGIIVRIERKGPRDDLRRTELRHGSLC